MDKIVGTEGERTDDGAVRPSIGRILANGKFATSTLDTM